MTIDELIERLTKLRQEVGNVDVETLDSDAVTRWVSDVLPAMSTETVTLVLEMH